MSVKFVNTRGKYEQCRYMGTSVLDADFVVVANWQGVEDEPIAESDNLVKSGGVYDAIGAVRSVLNGYADVPSQEITGFTMTDGSYIKNDGTIGTISGRAVSSLIDVSAYVGKELMVIYPITSICYYFYKADETPILGSGKSGNSGSHNSVTTQPVPSDAKYLRISSTSPNINKIALYVKGQAGKQSYDDVVDAVSLNSSLLKNIGVNTTTVWGDDDSHNFTNGNATLGNGYFVKLEPHFYTKIKAYVAANSSITFTFYHLDSDIGRVMYFHEEILENSTDEVKVIEKNVALDFSNEECLSFFAPIKRESSIDQYPGMLMWSGSLDNFYTKEEYDALTPHNNQRHNFGFSMSYIVPQNYENDSIIRTVRTSKFFKKKKYVAFGDSIMVLADGNLNSPYTIPLLIGKYFDMATVNRGVSGSVPIASSNLSDANLAYVDADTMLVTISGGQNNWITAEDINSTDRTTSIGAINYYIDQIRSISPKCVIVLCPTYVPTTAFNGTCNADYKRIAENKGVGLAPTTDLSIINWEYDRTPKVLRYDNIHPTEYGCIRFAAACVKYIEQMIL